jgi:type IV pilus assembly protein PilQ
MQTIDLQSATGNPPWTGEVATERRCAGRRQMHRWRLPVTLWVLGSLVAVAAFAQDIGPSPLRERLQKRISVEFRKTPVEDVIRIIAEQADVDVVTSPNVKGETTVKLTDVPLEEALRSILDVQGCDYVLGDNIIRVLTRAEMPQLSDKLATEVFEISYADVNEVVKSLDKFKSDSGSVSHIRGTSHLLVTDKESKLKSMGDFIRAVDRITPQVLVEARVYDVTSKDNLDLGVQWLAGTATAYDPLTGAPVAGETTPFTTSSFDGTISKTENTTAAVRFGWLNANVDIDVLLKAEQERLDAKLLANPRILVLDNETATIKIISEIPYQQLTQSALGGSIGTTGFREAGVELRVTAHLAARDQMIRLHLRPSFSVVTGEVQVAVPGANVAYPQPIVDRREADTKLLVRNGQTVVLGGLRRKEVTRQRNKVPLLGDLPLAGNLFRFTGERTINSELLVFITPWIVEQPTMSESESEAYKQTRFPAPLPAATRAEMEQDGS